MNTKRTKLINTLNHILTTFVFTVGFSLLGLIVGAIAGGNLTAPSPVGFNIHYMGRQGYEAGGLFGAHLGIVVAIIFSVISIIHKDAKIVKVGKNILFGFLFTLLTAYIGAYLGGVLDTSYTYSELVGGIGGIFFGIGFSVYAMYVMARKK